MGDEIKAETTTREQEGQTMGGVGIKSTVLF